MPCHHSPSTHAICMAYNCVKSCQTPCKTVFTIKRIVKTRKFYVHSVKRMYKCIWSHNHILSHKTFRLVSTMLCNNGQNSYKYHIITTNSYTKTYQWWKWHRTDPTEYDPFTCLNLMTEADAASRTIYNLNTPKTMANVQHKCYNALPLIMWWL